MGGLCAGLVLAGCSAPEPVSIERSGAAVPPSSSAPAPTTTTLVVGPMEVAGPTEVAGILTAAEIAIRNPATKAAELPALGQAQQRAYGALVAHPEWDAEVGGLVPESLRATVAANVTAGRELKALAGPVEADRPLHKWRIVSPDPSEQLLVIYKAAGAAAGVPWEFLAAIHLVETRMGRIKGDSTAGAQGPMQFIPTTWDIYGQGGDITSNRDAIFAAARLLRAGGAPANMSRALRAYNNSARYVTAVTAYAGQITLDERAYLGYHAWQVYYGPRLLPEGTVLG